MVLFISLHVEHWVFKTSLARQSCSHKGYIWVIFSIKPCCIKWESRCVFIYDILDELLECAVCRVSHPHIWYRLETAFGLKACFFSPLLKFDDTVVNYLFTMFKSSVTWCGKQKKTCSKWNNLFISWADMALLVLYSTVVKFMFFVCLPLWPYLKLLLQPGITYMSVGHSFYITVNWFANNISQQVLLLATGMKDEIPEYNSPFEVLFNFYVTQPQWMWFRADQLLHGADLRKPQTMLSQFIIRI